MARRAAERMQALQREADALAAEERTILVDLRRLEVDRELKAEELKHTESELQAVTAEIEETTRRIEALDAQERDERPGLDARLVELYKLRNGGYLRMLASTHDLRDFGRTYRTVLALATLDRRLVGEYRDTLDQLRAARGTLDARRASLATLRQDAERERAALDKAVAARTARVAQIDARRDLTAQLAGEVQSAQQKLQQALVNLAAGRPVATETVALPIRVLRGDLDWPAAGAVLAQFGRQRDQRSGTAILRNGIEIGAAEGTSAKAVHEGTVAYAAPFTGFGNVVILDHGGQAFSLYGHLASIEVAKGARIDRGQTVGTVGTAPAGPGALYFELRIDGKPVDPLQWLKSR